MAVFYGKRLARVGWPLAFWSVAYLLFGYATGQVDSSKHAVKLVLRGAPYFHLYFLFVICGLYLFVPFLRRFVRAASRREVFACAAFCLAMAFLSETVGFGVTGAHTRQEADAFSMFVPFLGYFLLGHALRPVTPRRHHRLALLAGYVLVALLVALGNYVLFLRFWPRERAYYFSSYPNLLVVIMAACAFLLLACRGQPRSVLLARAIAALAPSTLGIYLIHPMLRDLVQLRGPTVLWPTPAAGLVLWGVVIFGASYAITEVFRRLPLFSRVV